jgi:NAD(P)-dependent dehydrogenase (short-subunit alcohol dehydrogenase family)
VPPESSHDRPLEGGCAVVTGDGALAAGMAEGLAIVGCRVVLLGGVAAGAATVPCRFDSRVAVDAAFDAAASELGRVDLVVHAWIHPDATVAAATADLPEDTWAAGCEGTLDAALWVAQASLPHLRAGGAPGRAGALVFVTTTLAMAGGAGYAMLATAGEGVRSLAKSAAKQWAAHGVTVNTIAVAPQLVVGGDAGRALAEQISLAAPAFGRTGDPASDLSPLAALLASPAAAFAAGVTVTADGGVWTAL